MYNVYNIYKKILISNTYSLHLFQALARESKVNYSANKKILDIVNIKKNKLRLTIRKRFEYTCSSNTFFSNLFE